MFVHQPAQNNTLIIHDHKYAQIFLTDTSVFNKLRNLLSYKLAGIEYSKSYQNGWSGINYLLDKNGYFMLGLLNKVENFLQEQHISYQTHDKRPPPEIAPPIPLNDRLMSLGMVPRYYQENIVQAAISQNKGIVRAVTSSGKTLTTALITAHLNKPTIIYVIGLDLLQQFHDLYSKLFDEKIGFIGNGVCDIQRINIASIWTISSALKIKTPLVIDDEIDEEIAPNQQQAINIVKMLKASRLHIFDESHIVATDTIKYIFNAINPEHIYGFSGTPFREDNSTLLINGILGEQIINVSASELIKGGYIVPPIIKFVRVPKIHMGNGATYQSIYKEYITENSTRNQMIVQNTIELLEKGYQVLVSFRYLTHGKILQELFDEADISYEYLAGADSLETRNEAKERLMSGKSNLVLASSIFDIGVDIPSLSGLVLAGPNSSELRTRQRLGRILRKFEGKKRAAVVDFYDDVKYLKNHSKKRAGIYKSEDGFELIIPKNIPELK
jgi:superfamily II DNA or RNA helicase